MKFSNWGGNVQFTPQRIARPGSVEEIQQLVREARQSRSKIRVVGAGHSFSRLIETDQTLVSLENLTGLISVNAAENTATLWAGTSISKLGGLLEAHQLSIPNQGDIDVQAIAGALSTGTHGTGLEFAALAGFIRELEFVDGTGRVQIINESTPGDLLNAARVSLGCFGIITKITLKCDPLFILRDKRVRTTLAECLKSLPTDIRQHRHYEFFWFPYSPYAQIKTCDIGATRAPRSAVLKFLGDDLLERYLYGAICELTAVLPSLSVQTSRLAGWLMPDADYSDVAYRVYPSSRHVRFTEMEYVVPLEKGVECFLAIKDMIESKRYQVFFPIEFRVAGPDRAWISPMHGRESAIISLHVFRGVDRDRYFSGAEEIFKRFGGRPHWGKMHSMSKSEVKSMYPRWDDFNRERMSFDPDGIFVNSMLAGII